jgi:hypothetical protein
VKTRRVWIALLAIALLLAGCAAGPNVAAHVQDAQVAGFWLGLWHGLISPITFLVSLFNRNVNVYEVINNGNWYNFGFMIGVSTVFSGGPPAVAVRSRRRSRVDPRADR